MFEGKLKVSNRRKGNYCIAGWYQGWRSTQSNKKKSLGQRRVEDLLCSTKRIHSRHKIR